MAIHTSRVFYRRGISNDYNNFAFVAQANYTIPAPMALYLRGYQFQNRVPKIITSGYMTLPWNK